MAHRVMQVESVMKTRHSQQGMALLMLVFIVALIMMGYLIYSLDGIGIKNARDKQTAQVLAQAKAALIGYAAGSSLSGVSRPGDLPCPDNYPLGDPNEGTQSTPCNANALGRLPWKTLGLPDLRDDSGERLWYAVSSTFKENPRTGVLNSDTNGTITVRDSFGTIINNGSNSSAAIAVVIAPGGNLQRQDGLVQNRSAANYNIASHYLDNTASEDNSNFVDGGLNGFINGIVKLGANQQVIVNDRLITISQSDLMPLLEKRVANEVLYCLKQYALLNSNGFDRHPWTTDLSTMPSYDDTNNQRFGHVPDTPFDDTKADSGNNMSDIWPATCSIVSGSGWWLNWKELVFYAVADNHDPNTIPSPSLPSTTCFPTVPSNCLNVTTPAGIQSNKKAVVIVAGKTLAGQIRSSTASVNNYLENINALGGLAFLQSPPSASFNDVVVFY